MHVPRRTTSRELAARSPYDPHHIGGEVDQTIVSASRTTNFFIVELFAHLAIAPEAVLRDEMRSGRQHRDSLHACLLVQ